MSAISEDMCEIRKELEQENHDKCKKQWKAYEDCGERLEAAGGSFPEGATCEGWYHDYLHCMDNAVCVFYY